MTEIGCDIELSGQGSVLGQRTGMKGRMRWKFSPVVEWSVWVGGVGCTSSERRWEGEGRLASEDAQKKVEKGVLSEGRKGQPSRERRKSRSQSQNPLF